MHKVILRLTHSFRVRFAEWITSLSMFWWGIIVLFDNDLFQYNPFFQALGDMAPQRVWAIVATLFGAMRIVFLIINGAWRPSAHIRAAGAVLGTLVWGSMILASLTLDFVTPNVVFFCGYLISDLYSLWFAAEDAKLADLAHKKR